MNEKEREFRAKGHSAFFELDGVPIVEELKSKWRELADEYERFKHIQQPFALEEGYTGTWLTAAFRAHPLELDYMTMSVKRAAVRSWLPNGGVDSSDAEVDSTYKKLWELRLKQNRSRCPLLTSILEPLHPEVCVTYLYSTMEPGLRIPPHRGTFSDCLRLHFCLKEADECWLTVLDEKRTWRNGQVWGFDDSMLHSAEHLGTADRAVVIFDLSREFVDRELLRLSGGQRSIARL